MESHEHRVVITGAGAWTPYGPGWQALQDGLTEGRRCLTPFADASELPEALAGQITDLKPFRGAFPEVRPPLPIRITRFAMLAASDALSRAGLRNEAKRERARFGVMFNRNRGPADVVARIMKPILKGARRRGARAEPTADARERAPEPAPKKMRPLLFSQSVANAPLGAVATAFGLKGPHLLTMGGGALMLAVAAVRHGEAPVVLCGGLEELEAHCFAADRVNGVISPPTAAERVRPYEPDSGGPTFCEGAACLVVEALDHARERGATILAELASVRRALEPGLDAREDIALWGRASAASLAARCSEALAEAGVEPDALALHVGGGNGHVARDAAERGAVVTLGRPGLRSASIKGHIGDGLGFAGILSVGVAASALAERSLPSSTLGEGPGRVSLRGDCALVTQLDPHAQQLVAVLRAIAEERA